MWLCYHFKISVASCNPSCFPLHCVPLMFCVNLCWLNNQTGSISRVADFFFPLFTTLRRPSCSNNRVKRGVLASVARLGQIVQEIWPNLATLAPALFAQPLHVYSSNFHCLRTLLSAKGLVVDLKSKVGNHRPLTMTPSLCAG